MSHPDPASAYGGTRRRITDLVRDLPDATLDRTVPATPEWRLRDLVAHLAGVTADIGAGNLDGVAGDQWTRAQVEARRHTPLPEVLEEWERCSAAVEPLVGQFDPMMRAMFVTDAVTHEHDLRGALGRPGARDSDALALAFRGVTRGIGAQRDGAGAGALRIVHDAGESAVGTGDPMVTLHTTRFEIVRAAVGRRAEAQMAAWDWDGDARTQTMVLALFAPPRSTPLDE